MGLLSGGTVVVAALLAVALPLTTLVVWNRLGPNQVVRTGARVLLLALNQGLAVLLAGLLLNQSYDFYSSWSELLGNGGLTTAASPVDLRSIDTVYGHRLRAAYYAGHGTVIPWVIPGPGSGLPPEPALLYLPAAYGNPAAPDVRYPVVELLGGVPGTPATWTSALNLQGTLDGEIRSMQSLPFVAVIPTMNVMAPRDTQCVNVVHGPRVDTYLTRDVRNAVISAVRVQSSPAGWGLAGYSTGGYCALNLAMQHPTMYSAAAAMSGYARPSLDPSTGRGRLFFGNRTLIDQNTPLWEARHWHPRHGDLSILAIASRHDGPSFRDTVNLAAAARHDSSMRFTDLLLAAGGHNGKLWIKLEPVVFNWLSQHLSPPLADITVRTGLLPTITPPRPWNQTAVPVHQTRHLPTRLPSKRSSGPILARR